MQSKANLLNLFLNKSFWDILLQLLQEFEWGICSTQTVLHHLEKYFSCFSLILQTYESNILKDWLESVQFLLNES